MMMMMKYIYIYICEKFVKMLKCKKMLELRGAKKLCFSLEEVFSIFLLRAENVFSANP
jgi:hypothetical protein